MKTIDRVLQRWRIAMVRRYLEPGMRVLDVGADDGALARHVLGLDYVGIDPAAPASPPGVATGMLRGRFPDTLPPGAPFDAAVMLAVFEHMPLDDKPTVVRALFDVLRPDGRVLVTVPSPAVDAILEVLLALRLIDGMALEEHHHFEPSDTQRLFEAGGFTTEVHRTFQFGLNHLWVFRRP